ncbi:MAG: hypothetical protein ACREJ5_12010 [Geminicoccaceae bacterium]
MTALTPVGHLLPQIDARLIWFCVALLGIDAFFIAVHSIHTIYFKFYNNRVPILDSGWDIRNDWSYGEWFGYLKITMILSLLILIPQVWKRPIYLAFIAIFAFALADDALQIHERGGIRIAEALGLQPFGGLRPRDPGEWLVWTIVGVPLLAAAVVAVVRSPEEDRRNGVLLLGALAVLALFAVVIDMAHVVLRGAFWGAHDLFTVIEDGGEQFTLSLTCGLAILIRRDVRGREPRRAAPA